MPVRLNSTGGGSVTLDVPATAGTFTVNLPAANGDVVVTGGGSTVQFGAGSVSAPSITFSGDTNTGIYSPAADTIAFTEGGVEGMRINSSGNVGIGTSSPAVRLDVQQAATDYQFRIGDAGGSNFYDIGRNTTNGLLTFYGSQAVASGYVFSTVNGERMRIATNGTVGIGTASPIRLLTLSQNGTPEFVIQDTSQGADLKNWRIYSSGQAFIVGTLNDAGSAGSDVFRLTRSGNFLVGTSSTFDVTSGATTQLSGQCAVFAAGSPNTIMSFYNSTQSPRVGFIGSNGNSTSYNSGSDYRLKENVINISGAAAVVQSLRPVTFTWKFSPDSGTFSGFIAHELQEVWSEAVSGEKDGVCKDGSTPDYQMVDQSKLVPLLTAALKEALTRIDALEARLAAVEAR